MPRNDKHPTIIADRLSAASDLLQSVDDNQDHCSLTITPTVLDGIKHFRFKEIKVEVVLKSLKSLKTCKATGADGKPAEILKIEASPLPDIFAPVDL